MHATNKYFGVISAVLATVLVFQSAGAAELKAGDVINAANLDKVKSDTFEGHTIASLITEKMEFLIKNFNQTIKLRHSEEIPVNQRDIENTKKYAGEVKFDPKTNEVTGYKAGMAFPNIDMNDPKAGFKLVYNYYYMGTWGQSYSGPFSLLYIDQEKGVDRVQSWFTVTLRMKNRSGANPIAGDGNVVAKLLLYATAPYDIKGVGIFTLRYDSAQLEDNWVYVKSVRRTRQLSGGSWMDNLAGSVQLNDEYDLFAGRPSWYPEIKLLGKRWMLAVPHLKFPLVDESKKGTLEMFPNIDTKNKPYMNAVLEWEPREVYVIEVTTPKEHPYSKRIMYLETKFPRFYMTEHYDKSGQFVKIQQVYSGPTKGGDGYVGLLPWQGHTYDIKRKEGFIYIGHPGVVINDPKINPNEVTLGKLEAAAK